LESGCDLLDSLHSLNARAHRLLRRLCAYPKWLPGIGENYDFSIVLPQGGWREPKGAKPAKAPAKSLRTEPPLKDKAIELPRKLGTARTRDFTEIGISRHYLCKLCSEGVLTRAGYGRYATPKEAA